MTNSIQLDQFFTKDSTAKLCWSHLHSLPCMLEQDVSCYLEPSVGLAAFYSLMPSGNSIGIELCPELSSGNHDIVIDDFLHCKFQQKDLVTVGNPPFGRNSGKAIRFFNHAATSSRIIAFILPRSFKKVSMQSRLHPFFHLVSEIDLPENSFVRLGEPHKVPCCFQVWERRNYAREKYKRLNVCSDFYFVSREEADIAIRRTGRRAGVVIDTFSNVSPTSHFFIKICGDRDRTISRLKKIDLSAIKQHVAGPFSISKHEIVTEFLNLKANDAV